MLFALDDIRRKVPHCSQSALSGIIKELKRVGLPDLDDRGDMREARDMIVSTPTPYGPISADLPLVAVDGAQSKTILFASPLAMLWKAYAECDHFRAFMDERLAIEGCFAEKPWHIVLYCDEVLPGDQLGGRKLRKFQAVYYSFLEFGHAALSNENLWFTLLTHRSLQVAELPGKMALVFGSVLRELFVSGPMSDVGFELNHGRRSTRMFVKLGTFIMDGAAHKSIWHCKGDAGTKLCLLDRNVFSVASRVAEEDGTALLQCNVKKCADLDLVTSADVRDAVRRLEVCRHTDTPEQFEMREKALGFTYQPYNMLSDSSLDEVLDLEGQFLHDWMHMLFVTGVWNLTMNLVLEAVRPTIAGNIYALLRGYVERWVWPKRIGGLRLGELFREDKRASNARANNFKCSASEGLSLYAVVGHFLTTIVQSSGKCIVEIDAYNALCDVIDCMVAAATDLVDSGAIQRSVEHFLDSFDAAFGMEWTTPKFHWMLHFPDFHRKFKRLISCWPLERKHKVPKSYGTDVRNTRTYERSLLHEVTCDHLAALSDPDTFAFNSFGLLKPRAAPQTAIGFVRAALQIRADVVFSCQYAATSHPSERVYCAEGDVILFQENDGAQVIAGQIWSNLSVEGETLAIVAV